MLDSVREARARLERAKGRLDSARRELRDYQEKLSKDEAEAEACSSARIILQESARLTQEQVQYRISNLATLAMESVFDDPYKIGLEFENKYGRTSANLFFERDEESIDPLDASGGGAIDVASFGLQLSLWTLRVPRSRNLFILDEPLKWLKGGSLPEKGAEMIKQISHKLGVQIIMVSHIPDQIEHADKVFRIVQKRGVSSIK